MKGGHGPTKIVAFNHTSHIKVLQLLLALLHNCFVITCTLTESQQPKRPDSQQSRRPDSQLKLQRKGSDGAVKKHRVNLATLGPSATSPVESGTSSLPRNLPKGILSGGSSITAPSNHHEASELESSGSSSSSHQSADTAPVAKQTNLKKAPSLKKPASTSGLRSPLSHPVKSSMSKVPESQHVAPSKEEDRGPSPAAPATTSKLSGPLKKMPSASGLPTPLTNSPLAKPKVRRIAGPASTSKLPSIKQHPQVASLSSSGSMAADSLESLNSDIINVATSQKIDGEIAEVESESTKSSDVAVERESDHTPSKPVPKSLGIAKEGSPSNEPTILSPPAEFKIVGKTSHRDSRRISPEGMSQEDNSSTPNENLTKSTDEDTCSESVEKNLKNERDSAGGSPSLVIPRSQEGGETLPTDDKTRVPSSPVSDSKHLSSGMKIGKETGKRIKDQELKSKGFSQPETGQPAMDSPLLTQKSASDVKEPATDDVPHRTSRDVDQRSHEHGKPRARSLSPKASHRVGVVKADPSHVPTHLALQMHGLDFSRTASNDVTGGVRKPLKSSLRHSNSSAGVGRNPSSSSLEGTPGKGKVTISPRSSQVGGYQSQYRCN